MEKLFEKLGGRKMFLAIMLTIIATVFLFINKSDFEGWSNFMIWIFGSFAIGNGIGYIGAKK